MTGGTGVGTPKAVAEDSYVSLAEADEFFTNRLDNTNWDAATSADRQKALNMATAYIDSLPLQGYVYVYGQARQFPRKYKIDPNATSPWGLTLSIDPYGYCYESTVPQAVKDACCLEALAIINHYSNSQSTARETLMESGVRSYTIGELSETFGSSSTKIQSGMRSTDAYGLLEKYIEKSVAIV